MTESKQIFIVLIAVAMTFLLLILLSWIIHTVTALKKPKINHIESVQKTGDSVYSQKQSTNAELQQSTIEISDSIIKLPVRYQQIDLYRSRIVLNKGQMYHQQQEKQQCNCHHETSHLKRK